ILLNVKVLQDRVVTGRPAAVSITARYSRCGFATSKRKWSVIDVIECARVIVVLPLLSIVRDPMVPGLPFLRGSKVRRLATFWAFNGRSFISFRAELFATEASGFVMFRVPRPTIV